MEVNMKKVYLILAAMMLLCLAPMPYGYFMLVRFVAMVAFGVMAFKYYQEKKEKLAWVLGLLALLFQPFAKIALGRLIWNIVDVIVAIGFVVLFFVEKEKPKDNHRKNVSQISDDSEKLSRLVITKDFRILLPDYYNMEIKMEPLVKAVYFLFLKHPEGIMFKFLPDYREELTQIYVNLKPNGMNERVLQSIEDVTNPTLNSINEKCARISGAFQFDEKLARHYYIEGKRGEPKKISLPRDLVTWK